MKHIVLLGDSIFDNGVYVDGGPDVVSQLREILPAGWKATLLAVDGNVTADVIEQLRKLPETATHLVVSAGGNDALMSAEILHKRTELVATAVGELADMRARFQKNYSRMLGALEKLKKPLAVCTVYDPQFPNPTTQRVTTTALNIFNDCILREAITRGLPVIDLRLICSSPEDYANEIEPGIPGGKKIAAAILELVNTHNFSSPRTAIYTV